MDYPLGKTPTDQGIQCLGEQLLEHTNLLFDRKRIGAPYNFEWDQLEAQLLGFLVNCFSNLHPEGIVRPNLRTDTERLGHR